jgi:exodeoxyribonuclease V gamma subunit
VRHVLHVHRAERADTLADALAEVLRRPADDPFAAEVVAVPAKGVERWLAQRLSHRLGAGPGRGDGVCAHVAFPSPGAVVAAVVCRAAGADPDADPWQPARAVWPLLEVVDASLGESWCAPLAAHLGEAGAHRGRRLATARHLAELFAAYAAERPGMLRAWQAGDDSAAPPDLRWQPALWRRLRAHIGIPGPAERLLAACAALAEEPALAELPSRLSLFGPTRLPAEHLALLAALARHRAVHLWLPHPSPALWQRVAAAAGPRNDVPRRRTDSAAAGAAGHPLLSALGRDVREMQLRLAAAVEPGALGPEHHARPDPPPNLLGRLQRALRDDQPGPTATLDPADRSVQVHACHGSHRQVEVLREVVLGLLAADPGLEPRDVLVMCPEIETFAPLVSAAFGLGTGEPPDGPLAVHPGQRLPVRLADRALQQVNPLLDTAARLIELAEARLTASQVLDLLGTAPVRRRFALGEDDLERLRELVLAAGVRWGLDAAHRRSFGLERFPQNTWAAGLDRMLLGVAMSGYDAGEQHWLHTALPLDEVDSGDVERVGRLAEFVDRLAGVLAELAGMRPLQGWVAALTAAVETLTATTPAEEWQAAHARAQLAEITLTAGPQASTVPLALADVRALLVERLRARPSRANFRTGTLTVATMVPMRSVPHRVVCLLGVDDGVFPRAGIEDGDDVLARDPLVGERDVRSEDRQLLLDAVCAATEHLVVVCAGADERTGARRPFAVPLGELLDALDATAHTADGRPAREQVVVRHPLQPFDPRNFTPGALATPGPFSFDAAELAGAVAARGPKRPPPPFLAAPLPVPAADPGRVVELEELRAFVRHPVRAFLRQRVGVSVFAAEEGSTDALPVELDGLESWSVGERLLRDRLTGHDLERCRQAEWRRGALPPGALGHRLLATVTEDVEPLVAVAGAARAGEPVVLDVVAALPAERRVVGTVSEIYGDAIVRVEYSRLGPRHRLRAWVELLALTVAQPQRAWRAVTLGRGQHSGLSRSTLGPVPPEQAACVLADLVELHERGLCEPLPLAAATSHAYAYGRSSGAEVPDAIESAARIWCRRRGGERDDAAHQLVFGAATPIDVLLEAPAGQAAPPGERSRFGALALRLWAPLFAAETLEHP